MFITLTEPVNEHRRDGQANKVTFNIEHIVAISDCPASGGSKVGLSNGVVASPLETRVEIIALIEQAFAAERAAYTMFVDQGERDGMGWPSYNYRPKDQN